MAKNITERDIEIISNLRQDARMTLTKMAKQTGTPISTVYERLKLFRENGLVKPTALVDFSKLGFTSRIMVAIKVDKDIRTHVEEFLVKHLQVNTVSRINNGFTFMFDAMFLDMQEAEEFVEELEQKFKIGKKMLFYVIGEVTRETFLSDPAMLEVVLNGGGE